MVSYILSACYGAVLGLLLIMIFSRYDDITDNAVFLVSTWVSTILSITFFAEVFITGNLWYVLLSAIFIGIFIFTTLTNLDKCFDMTEEYEMFDEVE